MIKKLFIKNYKDTKNPEVRNRYGIVSGVFGIITNFILFLIKFIIGIISNSITIMADAFNNLSDSGSCIITILGFKLSNKPPDKEHPYGHKRYEYITAMIIALLIFSMGILFLKTSVDKMFNPEIISINYLTYIILLVAIIGKIIQMFVYYDFAKAIDSNTIKGNAIDARNDIISTTSVLVASMIMGITKINLDAYFGFIVSIFILISALKMLKDTINPLLGIVPDDEKVRFIRKKILSYDRVYGIHDLVIHNYGVGSDFVTVHIEVNSSINIVDGHNIVDNIEKDFKEKYGIHLTAHIDPIDINNEKVKILKEKTIKELKTFDKTLSIHDFRIVSNKDTTNILFDILIPFDKNYTKEEIINYLNQKFEEDKYHFIIDIDRPYS